MARIGIVMVLAQVAITGVVVLGHLDIIGFLSLYTCVYAIGALMATALMIHGPIRIAAGKADGFPVSAALLAPQ